MKKIFVLSAALLALGLASCTAQAPVEESSSATSTPTSLSSAPTSNPASDPTSVPTSSDEKAYDWNVIDENTNLKILAWDRYCEIDANSDDKATDDASCEGKGTAHVDALVKAYIATLPADTAVRVGVFHSTKYANDDVAALANDYDVVIGAGAKISPNYGATNRVAITDMDADANAMLATTTGRKVVLMSENEYAIAAYNYLGVEDYVIVDPTSEASSEAPTSESAPEESSEATSEATSEYSDDGKEFVHHDFVVAWYNKPATSGCSEAVVEKMTEGISNYIKSLDSTKTDIVFKGYEGNVAASCAAIEEDVNAGTLLPNILIGWKANLSFSEASKLTYNTIKDAEGNPVAFTVGDDSGTVKTDRYLITLQYNGRPVDDLTNSVVTWMQTEEGRACTHVTAA